jgi:DNA polymerase-3 subunit delta'
LRTPSISAVAKLLIERDGIDPKMAEFAASAAQGHIGRAKYLATNEKARQTREKITNIPFAIMDLASTFEAAETLLALAKEQALVESEIQDEEELTKLKESYGTTGSRLATGGNKAVKELEKEQKFRNTRIVRDNLDNALLDLATVYKDCLIVQAVSSVQITNKEIQTRILEKANQTPPESIVNSLVSLLEARSSLTKNLAPNLTTEALLLKLKVH